ncbi:protein kinase activating protein dpb11 [Malassezia furfur]|uniref:Protein kinase activating protein dpb11 n=1 Tax=Malassezia furfur TaxID=55194 RepID=A0ABY8ETW2_MALFU|nr:protein kinase activating protein dpb11 [Malassezia furfur]
MSTNRLQRTHRSTKIPNAKLRPVPVARGVSERAAADAEDDAHFQRIRNHGATAGAHAPADFAASRPLHGTVLSFTGIMDDKRELIDIAEALGATVHRNLTSDVTHLVARQPGSEKYRCAVRCGMHVVRPEWLHAVREAWLAGDDVVDTAQLADEHRLGALEGLCVAMSGVDDATRTRLSARIVEHGGSVVPRLTLDGSLTHLVCGPDDGRVRKSYTRVVEHQALARHYTPDALPPAVRAAAAIRLVHAAWVDDCCDAHVLLSEDEYDARAPLAPRPVRTARVLPAIERTASAPTAPAAPMGPAPPAPAKDVARLVARVHSDTHAPTPPPAAAAPTAGLLGLSRAARFAHDAPRLFRTYAFHVAMHDDARTRRVAGVVRAHGGTLVDAAHATYLVRPLCAPPEPAPVQGTRVTHHWIELCLFYDRLVDPAAHLACVPATAPMPVRGAERVRVSFTGVDRQGPEYHHAVAAIEAAGARVEDAFSRAHTTHLVCVGDARTNVKAQKAREWGVPVVGYAFLQAMLRGEIGAEAEGSAPREAASAPRADAPRTDTSAATEARTHPRAGPGHDDDAGGDEARHTSTGAEGRGAAALGRPAARGTARPVGQAALPVAPVRDAGAPYGDDAALYDAADAFYQPADAPYAPDAPDAPDPSEYTPHVLYDDPAARKERTRLLALVDGPPPKRQRGRAVPH